jgi:hypothetical protein
VLIAGSEVGRFKRQTVVVFAYKINLPCRKRLQWRNSRAFRTCFVFLTPTLTSRQQFLENNSAPGFPSWKTDISTKTNLYITFDDKYFLLLFQNSAIFFALSWPLTPSTLGPGVVSTPAQWGVCLWRHWPPGQLPGGSLEILCRCTLGSVIDPELFLLRSIPSIIAPENFESVKGTSIL